jgi:hypothetical protein
MSRAVGVGAGQDPGLGLLKWNSHVHSHHFKTCQAKGLKHTSLITIQPQSAVIRNKLDSPKLLRYRFAFQRGSCSCLDMALLCTAISLPRYLLTIGNKGLETIRSSEFEAEWNYYVQ